MKQILYILILSSIQAIGFGQTSNDYVQTSKDFLYALKSHEKTDDLVNEIESWSAKDLENGLKTNNERLAFWVNIYNGFIQLKLSENPELYEDRGSFFKTKFIKIGGENVAFADIEHGIIRRSQFEYFLGYVTNPFSSQWERKLRVYERDFRIHFALNCGALSCPPVAIYDDTKLDEQFNKSTKMFLDKFSTFKPDEGTVYVTSLFSWFRGDFGGKSGTKDILKEYGIISDTNVDLEYDSYDWTLALDNYIDLGIN